LRSNQTDQNENLEEQKTIVPAASPTRSISPRHIELPSTGISMISNSSVSLFNADEKPAKDADLLI
jgi:hypothetical protein